MTLAKETASSVIAAGPMLFVGLDLIPYRFGVMMYGWLIFALLLDRSDSE